MICVRKIHRQVKGGPMRVNRSRGVRASDLPVGAAPITVAIATHNRAQLLAEALVSCRNQIVKPEQIIVVDDGSTDQTAQIVENFEGVPVQYVNVGKVGLGCARNVATTLCRTRWLCIHDDDDLMLSNCIGDHLAGLSVGASLSHGGWINFNERGELDYHPGKIVDEDVILYAGNAITHGACCYDISVLRQFPYRTDIIGGADFDFAVRAIRSGIRCVHTESYVLLRRRHADSMSAKAAEGQAATRRAVVAAVDAFLSTEEVTKRSIVARAVPEIEIAWPTVDEVYRMLEIIPHPMRVAAWVPRDAARLFDRLAALAGHSLELFDPNQRLDSRLMLMGPVAVDGKRLDATASAFRTEGLRPAIVGAEKFIFPAEQLVAKTEAGNFRAVLYSTSLRELQLAYFILRRQRPWNWYVAVHSSSVEKSGAAEYCLVSAAFGVSDTFGSVQRSISEVRHFIVRETDIEPVFLYGSRWHASGGIAEQQ